MGHVETILDPDLPIIDPHHHLWERRALTPATVTDDAHGFDYIRWLNPRYLLDELMADISTHNVTHTVYIECGSMYRAGGPDALKPVGETAFVAGVAAMGESGTYGSARPCAGIVAHADLMLGDAVAPVLEAHMAAGGGRMRGIRHGGAWDADPKVLGPIARRPEGVFREPAFREGFKRLAEFGLSFDAWILEPQLDDLIDLARAFPNTQIILDHVGGPLGIAAYAGQREARFAGWKAKIAALAAMDNVVVKLGGLAMPFPAFPSFRQTPPATSQQLAEEWRPYIETCIEAFGPDRAMFESNFPVDAGACSYATLWNAFKRLAAGASADEKTALFSGVAARIYRLG